MYLFFLRRIAVNLILVDDSSEPKTYSVYFGGGEAEEHSVSLLKTATVTSEADLAHLDLDFSGPAATALFDRVFFERSGLRVEEVRIKKHGFFFHTLNIFIFPPSS